MTTACDSTRILEATLETDGKISLSLLFADGDGPSSATIEPTDATVLAAGREARAIDLEYGAEADRLLRLLVAMHVDALAYVRKVDQVGRLLLQTRRC